MDFRETSVEYISSEDYATFFSNEAKWVRQINTLLEQYPTEVTLIHKDYDSIVVHVPKSWLKIKPPRKMTLTDEQRAAAAERMSNARKKKGAN